MTEMNKLNTYNPNLELNVIYYRQRKVHLLAGTDWSRISPCANGKERHLEVSDEKLATIYSSSSSSFLSSFSIFSSSISSFSR